MRQTRIRKYRIRCGTGTGSGRRPTDPRRPTEDAESAVRFALNGTVSLEASLLDRSDVPATQGARRNDGRLDLAVVAKRQPPARLGRIHSPVPGSA